MWKAALVTIALLTTRTRAAPSEPAPVAIIDGGFSVGGAPWLEGDAMIEGSHRIAGPLWLHAEAALGRTNTDLQLDRGALGTVYTVHAGAELHGCLGQFHVRGAATLVCGFAGEDLGGRRVAWTSGSAPDDGIRDVIAVSSIGYEVISGHVCFRSALEVDHALAGTDAHHLDLGVARTFGADGTLTLGYRW